MAFRKEGMFRSLVQKQWHNAGCCVGKSLLVQFRLIFFCNDIPVSSFLLQICQVILVAGLFCCSPLILYPTCIIAECANLLQHFVCMYGHERERCLAKTRRICGDEHLLRRVHPSRWGFCHEPFHRVRGRRIQSKQGHLGT